MTSRKDDTLWQMLSSELSMPQITELRTFLREGGEGFDVGYGDLTIEPYDARGGSSRMFIVRHPRFGETTVSHSALDSLLHDLAHRLRA